MAQPGQRPAGRIYGIETRAELVEKSRALAERLGFDHMAFLNLKVAQATRSAELPAQVDIVTAVHACDTATDDAIAFGLQKQARHMEGMRVRFQFFSWQPSLLQSLPHSRQITNRQHPHLRRQVKRLTHRRNHKAFVGLQIHHRLMKPASRFWRAGKLALDSHPYPAAVQHQIDLCTTRSAVKVGLNSLRLGSNKG